MVDIFTKKTIGRKIGIKKKKLKMGTSVKKREKKLYIRNKSNWIKRNKILIKNIEILNNKKNDVGEQTV